MGQQFQAADLFSTLETEALAAGCQGDLIPWTVGQQFQDADFPALSGARIVRIAVHPELGRAGYGSRALELLRRYYEVSQGVRVM